MKRKEKKRNGTYTRVSSVCIVCSSLLLLVCPYFVCVYCSFSGLFVCLLCMLFCLLLVYYLPSMVSSMLLLAFLLVAPML